ncbi:MAG TPA: OmpA family protein [Ignavibacteriales bacterium]|nr:OmpA family protein [Ignavibacteriales bacterium]
MKSFLTFSAAAFILCLFMPEKSFSQFDILGKIKDKVEQRAEEKTDEAIDKGLDEVEKKATEENSDENEEVKAKKSNTQTEEPEEETSPKKTAKDDEPKKSELSLRSYSKYDFVPGEKVLFFEDFSQDNVGDFPARWNTNGTGEVVTINKYPGKWLKAKNGSLYVPDFPKPFPENYTIELDMVYDVPGNTDYLGNINFCIISSGGEKEYLQHAYEYSGSGKTSGNLDFVIYGEGDSRFDLKNYTDWGEPAGVQSSLEDNITSGKAGKIVRLSISVQKERYRVWIDNKKLYDLPKFITPAPYDIFKIGLWYFDDEKPDAYQVLFSNVRFAVGAPDMRNKLLTEGKLVTRGITFDSGSDKIKPESYGTLKEIAGVLKENSDLRVKIIGHTDSDGGDQQNLELSKKRSSAVKNALTAEFGIDASRMETDGKGESEPVSENTTPSGKANNRRVEFIKL